MGFCLMLVGISMIGVVTASIAAWFVGHVEDAEAVMAVEVHTLREDVTQLTASLHRLDPSGPDPGEQPSLFDAWSGHEMGQAPETGA